VDCTLSKSLAIQQWKPASDKCAPAVECKVVLKEKTLTRKDKSLTAGISLLEDTECSKIISVDKRFQKSLKRILYDR
jgi:hypothetical protein